MRIVPLSDPASEPVLLDEFKDHLRIDGASEDAALGAFISTARTLLEEYTGLSLVERSLDIYLDKWPLRAVAQTPVQWWSGVQEGAFSDVQGTVSRCRLPVRPVSGISAISVVSTENTETVWGADNYQLKPGLKPEIALNSGRRWPAPGRTLDGIKITLTAGFGANWNHVPASLRQAHLQLATYLYTHRGEENAQANAMKASGAEALAAFYRERRL